MKTNIFKPMITSASVYLFVHLFSWEQNGSVIDLKSIPINYPVFFFSFIKPFQKMI